MILVKKILRCGVISYCYKIYLVLVNFFYLTVLQSDKINQLLCYTIRFTSVYILIGSKYLASNLLELSIKVCDIFFFSFCFHHESIVDHYYVTFILYRGSSA